MCSRQSEQGGARQAQLQGGSVGLRPGPGFGEREFEGQVQEGPGAQGLGKTWAGKGRGRVNPDCTIRAPLR